MKDKLKLGHRNTEKCVSKGNSERVIEWMN